MICRIILLPILPEKFRLWLVKFPAAFRSGGSAPVRPASSQKFYLPGFLSSISVRKLPHFPAKPCPVSVFPCTAEERPWRRNDSSWRRSGLTHLGVVYSEAAVLYDTDSERDHIFRHAGCTLQSAASLEARHCSLDITDYRHGAMLQCSSRSRNKEW